MDIDLSHKTILITGGSSRLGTAFVRKAVEQGADVYFTYFSHGEEIQELIKLGAVGFELDLSRTADIDRFAADIKGRIKGLDVLIHNAAAVRDKMITDMSEEDWDYVLNVDLKAPFYLTKKLLSLLFKAKPSKVFILTSRVGLIGGFGVSNYAAAKAGVIGLTKSLAKEIGKKQVLVNAVNPGFMMSRMTQGIPEKYIQRNLDESPLGRAADPEEVADFLVYLSSNSVTQVTGQVLNLESRRIS